MKAAIVAITAYFFLEMVSTPPTCGQRPRQPTQLRSPATTTQIAELLSGGNKERRLAAEAKRHMDEYEKLERKRAADPSVVNATFDLYIQFDERLAEIRRREARERGEKRASEHSSKSAEAMEKAHQACVAITEKQATQIARLKVDCQKNMSKYVALKHAPQVDHLALRSVRRDCQECVEQLWAARERFTEEWAKKYGLEQLQAKRRQRDAEQRAKETESPR